MAVTKRLQRISRPATRDSGGSGSAGGVQEEKKKMGWEMRRAHRCTVISSKSISVMMGGLCVVHGEKGRGEGKSERSYHEANAFRDTNPRVWGQASAWTDLICELNVLRGRRYVSSGGMWLVQ